MAGQLIRKRNTIHLIGNIQNAEKVITREPAYASRGQATKEIPRGGTYAEVDLTAQHMYFVQNGTSCNGYSDCDGKSKQKRLRNAAGRVLSGL